MDLDSSGVVFPIEFALGNDGVGLLPISRFVVFCNGVECGCIEDGAAGEKEDAAKEECAEAGLYGGVSFPC